MLNKIRSKICQVQLFNIYPVEMLPSLCLMEMRTNSYNLIYSIEFLFNITVFRYNVVISYQRSVIVLHWRLSPSVLFVFLYALFVCFFVYLTVFLSSSFVNYFVPMDSLFVFKFNLFVFKFNLFVFKFNLFVFKFNLFVFKFNLFVFKFIFVSFNCYLG